MGKDLIWDSTHLGQGNQTQRPYMGKDLIWDLTQLGQGNQTQKTIGFNTVGRKTRPRDHIWAKTIYGIQHSGIGKSDLKDDRIQHSWDRETRPKKTILYGIQHSGTGKPDPKTIYGQKPYMGKDHI